ncbi:hypothetical protein AAG570_004603 [Ranatra chinensis]|uniref:Uncharacterized protein n=1 Tax=Ranatra chinensis TaxID=642074 RepID=A0ABD0Y1C0_9HEMI
MVLSVGGVQKEWALLHEEITRPTSFKFEISVYFGLYTDRRVTWSPRIRPKPENLLNRKSKLPLDDKLAIYNVTDKRTDRGGSGDLGEKLIRNGLIGYRHRQQMWPCCCDGALGMESGGIPDSSVTASSSYVPNVGPKNGSSGVWASMWHQLQEIMPFAPISLHELTSQRQTSYEKER